LVEGLQPGAGHRAEHALEAVPPADSRRGRASRAVEYDIEILSTANLFRAGHRICVEITSMDRPTGVAGATDVEYVPYHVCSSRTTLHHVFHSTDYPSHLLLPLIPEQPHARENQEAGAENG
jgi:predicted acyl esterase